MHGFKNVFSSARAGLDVLNQSSVKKFFKQEKPQYVFLSSIRSGGIQANIDLAAEFLYENLECQNNIIHASYQFGVKKLLFFNSSCTYPKDSPQPMKEEYFLTGALEETSASSAVAKIAGVKLCQTYYERHGFKALVAVPATVYGPGSDVRVETAHVLGALIGKFYEAKQKNLEKVVVWGTGHARREFLFADDFVDACLFLMKHYNSAQMINVGCGHDVSIKELAEMIQKVSGFKGKIIFDKSKPDGVKRKLLDNRRLKKLGWVSKTTLQEGVERTYRWHQTQKQK